MTNGNGSPGQPAEPGPHWLTPEEQDTWAALAGERVRDPASGMREWANGQSHLRARSDAG